MFRMFVQGGGCSGLQVGLTFDDVANENDEKCVEPNGVTVLIDSLSLPYLDGANLDIGKDEVGETQFIITVPSC